MRPDFIKLERWTCKAKDNVLLEYVLKPDHRPADQIKKEIYENEIKDKYDVLFVLEDDPKCVKMYRDLGLICLDVGRK